MGKPAKKAKPNKKIKETKPEESAYDRLVRFDPKEPKQIPDFVKPIPTQEVYTATVVTNPNGANQFFLDPRQLLFWKYYTDPKGETIGNAYQSAIKAGYSDSTASKITQFQWFTEKWRRMNLLHKAEKVMEQTLETDHIIKKIGMFGAIIDPVKKQYVYEVDSAILGIKNKVAMFIAERVGKEEGYSTRKELTGKDGEKLGIPILGDLFEEEVKEKLESKNEESK